MGQNRHRACNRRRAGAVGGFKDSKTNAKRSRVKVVGQRALHVEAKSDDDEPEGDNADGGGETPF